ncbi:MAG: LL-diaminopimelate aminotransferase [Firmicutes bacterium]|nr:LL-diaminopimelate aminotransferase [Bacillota bacterium]
MKPEAKRIQNIPPYLFARIEQKIEEARERGVDIISLGIGDPDLPTPEFVIKEMAEQIKNPVHHQYPSSVGTLDFRKAVAAYYKRRFGADIDPKTEVCTLIGSKEGIANINYCYVDPGDINLVPDPGYPVYGIGTMLAGGESYLMPLLEENGFMPDLDAIPEEIARKAKIMFLNYPNNPTGAIGSIEFFKKAIDFAKKYDILICHDAAYAEMTYDGYIAPSIMEVEGAKDVAIEFNSLSKPFNMTGWRIGFAVGNPKAIATLARYKSNVDSGAFQAIQYAGIAGLNDMEPTIEYLKTVYSARRNIMLDGMSAMGWELEKPKATFYVWAKVPKGFTSESFAEDVLEKCGVIITPGNGYGTYGEGYFRATLTVPEDRMAEAMERMKKVYGKLEFE